EHYIEQSDGSFKIDLEGGVKTQADIDKLKEAAAKEREDRIEIQKELDNFKGVDLEKWEKLKHYDPDSVSEKKEVEIRKELAEEYEKKENELNAKVENAEQRAK